MWFFHLLQAYTTNFDPPSLNIIIKFDFCQASKQAAAGTVEAEGSNVRGESVIQPSPSYSYSYGWENSLPLSKQPAERERESTDWKKKC